MARRLTMMVGFRARPRSRDLLEMAAECADVSRSEFIRSAALKEAARVLAEKEKAGD